VASSHECGDEPLDTDSMELVSYSLFLVFTFRCMCDSSRVFGYISRLPGFHL
jgi:hypothetical protein